MIIELPERLETALKVQATAHGVSAAGYVRDVLERDLGFSRDEQPLPGKEIKRQTEGRIPDMGSELVAAMQASPFKEICLEPGSERAPVRNVVF